MQKILAKAAKIKLVVFDVDGVLTDRTIYLGADGVELKAFNAHDGFGIKALLNCGIDVGIITSRQSPIVERRMAELGVNYIYQGQIHKLPALTALCQILQLNFAQVAYVGDDLPDLPLIKRVGLGIAVADAIPFVRQHADWQTQANGGKGAAREVCELIMQAHNSLDAFYESYL